MEDSETQKLIVERKEKILEFIKKKSSWFFYVGLAMVVYIAVWIRTRNLPGLRDITTGGWTLGPDLDPFLFLRYTKYIVEHGSLFALDAMRYVPLGIETGDFTLHYYSIAWFHKLASIFGSGSVEQSVAIFPVFMFAFTVIGFFLLSREIIGSYFDKSYSNLGGLISTLLFSLFPLFIPRSIAGIPEKESSAFLFMFLAFYFFIKFWNSPSRKNRIIWGLLAGISTGLMALIWGAYAYIFFMIIPASFISFVIGNFEKRHLSGYLTWIFSSTLIMLYFSNKYGLGTVFNSLDRGVAIALLVGVSLYHLAYHRIKDTLKKNKILSRIPPRLLVVLIFWLFLVIFVLLVFGPNFILSTIGQLYSSFVRPAPSRLIQTVAENRQPYLTEWIGNFGPRLGKLFLTFWLFLIGVTIAFWNTVKKFDFKEKTIITLSFILMISTTIFSRYSPSSLLNGQNTFSLFIYGMGMLVFVVAFVRLYLISYKKNNMEKFASIRFECLLFFLFVFVSLVSARGFIRLVMIVVPPASIAIGYLGALSLYSIKDSLKNKRKSISLVLSFILIISILFTSYHLFISSKNLAENYIPSSYNQQWQKAMAWTRENTLKNSVFGHWWDYGYWVQSIGERATTLDGGNSIPYWNHLMGRYALTGTDFSKTLEFLYAHDVTHFLIDSTDIGKYSAFSTIGSNATYDRRSWIPTLLKDNSQTTERKNTTIFVYSGATSIDQDIIYKVNDSELFLPEGKTYLAAIITTIDEKNLVSEVTGVYFFQGKTYQIPLRYYWDKKSGGFVDTGRGLNAGVFIYPRVTSNNQGGGEVESRGAIIYLSPRVVKTNLARFYLYGEFNENFKLAHSEDDYIVNILKSQNAIDMDFIFFNELRGPIKIWEVNYPSNIALNKSYLRTDYPDSIRLA